ncbi:hypothetical protein ACQ4M3_37250 [Leptolyngbya sp. AN03gr2]|uniref:hypothetical protein n=1 Tax=unclassified Leptolyngbya TaxID=2650499 RepID=UPI003D3142EC
MLLATRIVNERCLNFGVRDLEGLIRAIRPLSDRQSCPSGSESGVITLQRDLGVDGAFLIAIVC